MMHPGPELREKLEMRINMWELVKDKSSKTQWKRKRSRMACRSLAWETGYSAMLKIGTKGLHDNQAWNQHNSSCMDLLSLCPLPFITWGHSHLSPGLVQQSLYPVSLTIGFSLEPIFLNSVARDWSFQKANIILPPCARNSSTGSCHSLESPTYLTQFLAPHACLLSLLSLLYLIVHAIDRTPRTASCWT